MSETKVCSWCLSAIAADAAVCPNCGYNGTQRNPAGALPLGAVLAGRYRIGRYLKVDGEGLTYLCYDTEEKRPLRVKEYMPATLCLPRGDDGAVAPRPGCEVLFKTTMLDFAEVYKNAERYRDMPVFMGVYGLVRENGTVYALRELSDGVTLAQYLENLGGPMDFQNAMDLLAPVFEAVGVLHRDNVIHRGISPETILISHNGKAKLSGYATQAMRTGGSELMSTTYKGYTAPEQYNVADYQGTFTDMYALGAVLYTCITGLVPPKGNERVDPAALPLACKAGGGKISFRQSEVIDRAMSVDPSRRPKTVEDFVAQLNGSYKPEKRAPVRAGLSRVQIGLVAAACVLLLLVIYIAVRSFMPGDAPSPVDNTSESGASVSAVTQVDGFVGMPYASIQANPQYQANYLFVTEAVFSDVYKAGEVVYQTPAAGTAWSDGLVIHLQISKGPQVAEVPSVIGQTLENATSVLRALGIQYDVVPVVGDGSLPMGSVSGMDKRVGAELRVNSEKLILYVVQAIAQSEAPSEDFSEEEPSSEPPAPPSSSEQPTSESENGNTSSESSPG